MLPWQPAEVQGLFLSSPSHCTTPDTVDGPCATGLCQDVNANIILLNTYAIKAGLCRVLPLEVSKHVAKENWHHHSHFTDWQTEGKALLHGLIGQCHRRKCKADPSPLPFQSIASFIMVLRPPWPLRTCPVPGFWNHIPPFA